MSYCDFQACIENPKSSQDIYELIRNRASYPQPDVCCPPNPASLRKIKMMHLQRGGQAHQIQPMEQCQQTLLLARSFLKILREWVTDEIQHRAFVYGFSKNEQAFIWDDSNSKKQNPMLARKASCCFQNCSTCEKKDKEKEGPETATYFLDFCQCLHFLCITLKPFLRKGDDSKSPRIHRPAAVPPKVIDGGRGGNGFQWPGG